MAINMYHIVELVQTLAKSHNMIIRSGNLYSCLPYEFTEEGSCRLPKRLIKLCDLASVSTSSTICCFLATQAIIVKMYDTILLHTYNLYIQEVHCTCGSTTIRQSL